MITSEPGQKGKDEFFTIYHIVYHRRTLERETMYMLYYYIHLLDNSHLLKMMI